jgi:myo-inositol-1(or 4)-monophosphatase
VPDKLLESAIEAARQAGQAIEAVRASAFTVDQKGDAGPVTAADRSADRLLREQLLALHHVGWLSEETADTRDRLEQKAVWVVDPLDGTKEFVKGLPEYVVAIGLVEHGVPVLGVIHNPQTGETFWAQRDGGAFRDGVRIHVGEGNRLLASRSETKRGEFAPFADWRVDAVGSIQYKLALVAAGEGAVTLSRGPKHEWDVCAGALIVTEAGGTATDMFGEPLQYNQSFPKVPGILAGAPKAYDRALSQLRETGASDRMDELGISRSVKSEK